MKKTLLVLVMIALAFSMVFAGGKKETAKTAAAAATGYEKMNISVFTIQQRDQPPADNKIYKWIEEKFGKTFDWDILVGDKDQKIGVLIASGDLPDLVEVDSEKFQGAGCLIDIKEIVENECPNIYNHYKNVWANIVDADTDADGNPHVYSLPNYGVIDGAESGTYYNQNAWWIQKEVLKEYGYPTIKTIDQYFDLLEAYATKYPTIDGMKTLPFTIICADWEAFDLWNPPNFLAGNPNDGNGHVVANADGTYTYVDNFTDDNAYRWFKLANGYFQRGLIDPECFTDNRDQYYAKLAQGRVLGMFIQGWQFMGNVDNTLLQAGKYNRTYAPLPVVFDETIKPHYRDSSLPNLQRGYGFTVNCGVEKAKQILKFFDELLKPENQKVLYWGIEGEDYYIDADGSITGAAGRPYRTQAQRDEQKDNNWILHNKAQLLMEEAPKLEGYYPDGYATNMDNLPWEYAVSQRDEDIELWDAYGVGSYAELIDAKAPANAGWYPMWQCNPSAENGGFEAEAAEAMAGFETVQRKYLPKMIMGSPDDFDATWAEYCALLKPLTAVYNEFMQGELEHRVELFGGLK